MRRVIVFAIATIVSTLPMSAEAAPIQWEVGSGGNGHFYDVVLVPDLMTWDAANAAAEALPGDWHLATLTSATESAFVESLLDSSSFTDCVSGTLAGTICTGVWIGARASAIGANDWQWVTGEPFSFTDWGPFEPFGNGDRIRLDWFQTSGAFRWNDARNILNPARGYVVERRDGVPEPATLSLIGLGIAALVTRKLRSRRQI